MRKKHSGTNEPEIDYAKVGKKMQELRISQGVTQEKVATDLDVTVAFVSNVENNRTKLNLRVLTYYAELCHVSVQGLLDAGRVKEENAEESETEMRIRRALSFYTTDEKQKILRILKVAQGKE